MKTPIQKKLTIFLTCVLIFIAIIISGYLFFTKYFSSVPIKIDEFSIDSKAALKLNILKQVSKRDGITEWELTANSATLLKNEGRAVLDEVSVLFFTKDNKSVVLTSQSGILDTNNHDMTFSGNIVIKYETAELKTEQLQYNKKDHIIIMNTAIRLEDMGSFISADKARIELNQNKIFFEGNVKGEFYDKIRNML
jgi:LPS export ABC transporter protein LptC